MRRTAPLVAATLLWLAAAACSDSRTTPTAVVKVPTGPMFQVSPSLGPLDTHIRALIDSIFDKGKAKEFTQRWAEIVKLLSDSKGNDNGNNEKDKKGPDAEARKKFAELVKDLLKNSGHVTPPAGETVDQVLARLVLYMSLYVYGGASTPEPNLTTTSDAVLGVVYPGSATTLQTPLQHAGVTFPAGAVTEPTIVVVTLETTYYPLDCSGPLDTHLCQYPQFYHFNVFPDVRLQVPATVAVCHVNVGNRSPLEGTDHNLFRLAHDKPASPADYVTGGTIVEGIEILPLVWVPTLISCAENSYVNPNPPTNTGLLNGRSGTGYFGSLIRRGGNALRTVASAFGRFISPRSLYAIDGGGGGEVMDFSNFAVVDPGSASELLGSASGQMTAKVKIAP